MYKMAYTLRVDQDMRGSASMFTAAEQDHIHSEAAKFMRRSVGAYSEMIK
jgi:hypothetical protein